jgi:hypothetical protein
MAASDLTWWRVDAIEWEALLKLEILVPWTRFVGWGGNIRGFEDGFGNEDSKGP